MKAAGCCSMPWRCSPAPGSWCRSILTVSAFGGEAVINAWPKSFLPEVFAPETMTFFFGVAGVWQAILNSILVALMTMVMAILLGAPAGYALARFNFGARTPTGC